MTTKPFQQQNFSTSTLVKQPTFNEEDDSSREVVPRSTAYNHFALSAVEHCTGQGHRETVVRVLLHGKPVSVCLMIIKKFTRSCLDFKDFRLELLRLKIYEKFRKQFVAKRTTFFSEVSSLKFLFY